MLALTQTTYTNENITLDEECLEFYMNNGCENKFIKGIAFHFGRCILL